MNAISRVAYSDPPQVPRPGPRPIPQAGHNPAPAALKRTLHILCIDDDAVILEVTKDCLMHFEHQVRAVPGGKFGIEVFRAAILESEPYDVVITDLRMPDMDGYEVARIIKDESPHTPVIMMTGEDRYTGEETNTASVVDFVVGKPARMRDLNELLLRATADHSNWRHVN
jgi:CheY-like chemotaxis protein